MPHVPMEYLALEANEELGQIGELNCFETHAD